MRSRLLIALLAITALHAHPAERWTLQYFHDADDKFLMMNDLRFITPQWGMAVGALVDKETGRATPAGLATRDGGRTWSEIGVPDIGVCLFFFDGDLGWMAGAKGIWRTNSFGHEWSRIKGARGLMSISFGDREHGWAVGGDGAVYRTTNGGRDWTKIALPKLDAAKTIDLGGKEKVGRVVNYSPVAFADGNFGVIAGAMEPHGLPNILRRRLAGQPAEIADGLTLQLSTTVLLTTHNGGETWERGLFVGGRILRVRLTPFKTGLLAIESAVGDGSWIRTRLLSTVAGIGPAGAPAPTIKEPPGDMVITDVHLAANGTVYVAGYEPPGTFAHAQIPGKLKVLRSADGRRWSDILVDYRAVARRAVLAPVGGDLWVDTGMILKLVAE